MALAWCKPAAAATAAATVFGGQQCSQIDCAISIFIVEKDDKDLLGVRRRCGVLSWDDTLLWVCVVTVEHYRTAFHVIIGGVEVF